MRIPPFERRADHAACTPSIYTNCFLADAMTYPLQITIVDVVQRINLSVTPDAIDCRLYLGHPSDRLKMFRFVYGSVGGAQ